MHALKRINLQSNGVQCSKNKILRDQNNRHRNFKQNKSIPLLIYR